MKPKVIVILGPTASGKTALSIELAKRIGGEIVSSDSMQIYKEMNIGSAKPTLEEMQGIKHYMIDIINPDDRYSVADYKKDAQKAIDEILQKNKVPIIIGGTGLYSNSLIYNIEYRADAFDEEYRKELEEKVNSESDLKSLYDQAKKIDHIAMEKISPKDKKRILRVLEIFHTTGKTKTELEIESKKKPPKYDFKIFAIDITRDILYDRINKRVDMMIERGLIDEVKNIIDKYNILPTSLQALGYKETKEYLDGNISKEEMIEKIKQETRRYAKRQLTWFRKNKDTIWLDGLKEIQENIDFIVRKYVKYKVLGGEI